jgi:geranylgeranyl diphosphate synthase type I
MFLKIRKRLEKELAAFIRELDKEYSLSRISPLLFKSIREFVLRKGKRIRPALFAIGYLGYARKPAANLYRSAVSLELLHDFLLVHDDIIDKSSTRRGRPSMHGLMDDYLKGRRNLKFTGQDLAIVAGDVIYAMAIHAFLAVRADRQRKEAALKKLLEAVLYTGSGEFLELILSLKPIEHISKNDIYKIYDLKTAKYTFSIPLVMGATLAGAKPEELRKLYHYGIYLGRAFQIRDDILGTFAEEKNTGKSELTDLKEAKKTILLWQAFRRSNHEDRAVIKRILNLKNAGRPELKKMRTIISSSGALGFAQNEISRLAKKAQVINSSLGMKKEYRQSLKEFSAKIFA